MKSILVYFENYDHFVFFNRFRTNLKQLDYDLIAVTQKPSLYCLCFLKGYICKLIFNSKSSSEIRLPSFLRDWTKDRLSDDEVKNYYASAEKAFEKVISKYNPEISFIFNGLSIPAYAQSQVSQKQNIKTLFFELANLPGKIFVAPDGVNAHSILYKNPGILKSFSSTEEEFNRWKEKYLVQNPNNKSKNLEKLFRSFLFIFDFFFIRILNIPKSGEYNLKQKFKDKFILPKSILKYDNIDIKKCKYIFFPLQINYDTQLLLNSDVDLVNAIKKISKIAKNEKSDLIIKPHPKETDTEFIKKIMFLKEKYNFYLINRHVKELIENSYKVITINSTVGLEAMIAGKEVEFLGRTFYSKLKGDYLRNYILKYLINVEYNSREKIDTETIKEMLSRCDIEKT